MHSALTWSDPNGRASIRRTRFKPVQRYRFALRTADFLICRVCGAYAGAVLSDGGSLWSTLNLRLSALSPQRSPASYGDEDPTARLARRKRAWTPSVLVA